MVVASRLQLRSPLIRPLGTFSPRAGRRASDLHWDDKLRASHNLHFLLFPTRGKNETDGRLLLHCRRIAVLRPACGEKVPEGRMRGAFSSQEGLTAIHPIRCGPGDGAASFVATSVAPTGAAGDAVGDNGAVRGLRRSCRRFPCNLLSLPRPSCLPTSPAWATR